MLSGARVRDSSRVAAGRSRFWIEFQEGSRDRGILPDATCRGEGRAIAQLADYLETLCREGVRDSSGQFTVDYGQARRKVGGRLFADPYFPLLKLVQCAVLGGSPFLQFFSRPNQLLVRFLCPQLDLTRQKDIPNLLYRAVDAYPLPVWQMLALALQAAQAQDGNHVGFATRSRHGGRGLLIHEDRLSLLDIPAGTREQTECLILLRGPRFDPALARTLIAERCRFCPAELRWNRQLLNGSCEPPPPPGPFGWLVDRLYLSHAPLLQGLVLPPFWKRPAACYDAGWGHQDSFTQGATLLQQWRSYNPHVRQRESLFPRTVHPKFKLQSVGGLLPWFRVPKGSLPVYLGRYRPGYAFRGMAAWQMVYLEKVEQFQAAPFGPRTWWGGKQKMVCGLGELRLPSLPDAGAPNQLSVVHHGVLLDPVPVELEVAGAAITLCDAAAQTDLSGLKLAGRDRLDRITDWLRHEVAVLKDDVRKTLHWAEKFSLPRGWKQTVIERHRLAPTEEDYVGDKLKPVSPQIR